MEISISFRLSCLCIMITFLKLTVSQSEMDPMLAGDDDNVSSQNWSNEGERREQDEDELNPQIDRKVLAKASEEKYPYSMQRQQYDKKLLQNMKSKDKNPEDLNAQQIDQKSSNKAPSKDILDEPLNQVGQKLPPKINEGKVLDLQGNQNASMNKANSDEGKDLNMSNPQAGHIKSPTKVYGEDDHINVSTNSNEGNDPNRHDQQADQKSLTPNQHDDKKLSKKTNRNKDPFSQLNNIDENQEHLKESAKKTLPMQDDDRLNQLEIEFRKSISELKLQNEEQRAEIKHLKGKRTESDERLRATQEEVQSLKAQLEIQTMNVQQLEQSVKSDDKQKTKSHQNTISNVVPKGCWDLNSIGNSYEGFYLVKGRKGEERKMKIIYCSFNQPGTHDGIDEKFVGFIDYKSFPDGIHFYVQKNNATLTEGLSNIIRFEQEKLDIGDAMNPDTGIFTAPANGTYHFAFTGTCNKVGDNSYVSLHHNKIEIGRSSSAASPSSQNSPSGAVGRKYRRAMRGFGFNSVALGAAMARASSQSRYKVQTVQQYHKPSPVTTTKKPLTVKPTIESTKKPTEEVPEDEAEEDERPEVTEADPLSPNDSVNPDTGASMTLAKTKEEEEEPEVTDADSLNPDDVMNPDTGISTALADDSLLGSSSQNSMNSPYGAGGKKFRRALKGFGFNSVAMGAAIGRAASSSQSRPKAQTVHQNKPSASSYNINSNKPLTEKPAMKPMKKPTEEESQDETEEEEEEEVTEVVPLNPFLQRKMKSTTPAPQLTTKNTGVFGGLQSLYSNLFQKKDATQQQQNISSESINPPASSSNSNIITMTLQSVLKLEVGDRVYMNSYVKALPGVPAVCTAHFIGSLLEQA